MFHRLVSLYGRGLPQLPLNGLAAAGDRGYNGGTMFSISKFLGHDEKFYDLLEASAQQADSSVHHLIDLLAKLEKSESTSDLAAFAESRREDKRITQQLTEELSKTFITPLEREDIQALASALYKIPKTVEKIGERILICPENSSLNCCAIFITAITRPNT